VHDSGLLVFRHGLPGFPGERRFALIRWGATPGSYSVLVDVADPQVRFLVTPPGLFFPDYEIELDDATVAALDIVDADEALLLVIVTLHENLATANLLGPIVINTRTRHGMQTVAADAHYATQVPLVAA
jgi:flagellar assembly factor FliW